MQKQYICYCISTYSTGGVNRGQNEGYSGHGMGGISCMVPLERCLGGGDQMAGDSEHVVIQIHVIIP